MILKDIILFETRYLKSNNAFLFLALSQKNLKYFDSIFELLEKNIESLLSKEKKNVLNDIDCFLKPLKINFLEFTVLNSNLKIFLAYLVIFVLKTLNESLKIKYKEDGSYLIQNINLNFLINTVIFNITQFKI